MNEMSWVPISTACAAEGMPFAMTTSEYEPAGVPVWTVTLQVWSPLATTPRVEKSCVFR